MERVKLVKLPKKLKRDLAVKAIRTHARAIKDPRSPEEVKNYFRMYVSGYTMQEVADYFGVKKSRVDRTLIKLVGSTRAWKKLSRENKMRRLSGVKPLKIKKFMKEIGLRV